jgi:hypothetical protein
VNDSAPASDCVSVFEFDQQAWSNDWGQVYDVQEEGPHVLVLQSQSRGNHKQLLQQGAYTYSTALDQERHIRACEESYQAEHGVAKRYLNKHLISVHEKPAAMRDLGLMGISAMTLSPGIEGICRHLTNALFSAPRLGLTPGERTEAFLAALDRFQVEHPSMGADSPNSQEEGVLGNQGEVNDLERRPERAEFE